MFEGQQKDTIKFALHQMLSTEQINEFTKSLSPDFRLKGNKSAIIRQLEMTNELSISIDDIKAYCFAHWKSPQPKMHINNLRSGILKGHGWHGTMPSTLHLSLQGKVREVCQGKLSLEELIRIGGDITKHEYFIVAIADICEHLIITKFGAIPSIISRGVADFILDEYPYDLKNTTLPEDWSIQRARKNPAEFITSLMAGADIERLRKQAAGSINNWALNRFYVVSSNENIWIDDPEQALTKLEKEIKGLGKPLSIQFDGKKIMCQIVFVT